MLPTLEHPQQESINYHYKSVYSRDTIILLNDTLKINSSGSALLKLYIDSTKVNPFPSRFNFSLPLKNEFPDTLHFLMSRSASWIYLDDINGTLGAGEIKYVLLFAIVPGDLGSKPIKRSITIDYSIDGIIRNFTIVAEIIFN